MGFIKHRLRELGRLIGSGAFGVQRDMYEVGISLGHAPVKKLGVDIHRYLRRGGESIRRIEYLVKLREGEIYSVKIFLSLVYDGDRQNVDIQLFAKLLWNIRRGIGGYFYLAHAARPFALVDFLIAL